MKRNHPGLISVIVPVYNAEEYLMRGLDSLKNQTYADIEVILVDDGSTDSSGAICDRYAAEDPRFHVIHQNNLGAAAATNCGIEACHGDYLMFMDDDDYMAPDMGEKLLGVLLQEKVDISICGFFIAYPDGRCVTVKNTNKILTGKQAVREYFEKII